MLGLISEFGFFLSSVSPTYLRIPHTFWHLERLTRKPKYTSMLLTGNDQNGSKLTWVNRQNEKKTNKKPMERNAEENSIVSAGFHTSSVCSVRAACKWQNINLSSNGNHLNLNAEQQDLGKGLVPHGFHQLGVFLQ